VLLTTSPPNIPNPLTALKKLVLLNLSLLLGSRLYLSLDVGSCLVYDPFEPLHSYMKFQAVLGVIVSNNPKNKSYIMNELPMLILVKLEMAPFTVTLN
jgi:hypothetical protein